MKSDPDLSDKYNHGSCDDDGCLFINILVIFTLKMFLISGLWLVVESRSWWTHSCFEWLVLDFG